MSDSTNPIGEISILKGVSVKNAVTAIVSISILAVIFLFYIIYFNESVGSEAEWVNQLPFLNATLNTFTTMMLLLALQAVRLKQYRTHMTYMILAFTSSAFFLVSYIIYHTFHGDTPFEAQGFIRFVYFFILITHILLSIFVVPMVLTTFYFSLSGQLSKHKRLARYTYPIWLYVSITGVLIVVLLNVFNQ